MDENLHDIEDLFFSELNDNEETPSEKVWGKVDKRLDKESVISIEKKYTRLKKVAILLLLLLGISLYEIHTIDNRNNLAKNDNHHLNNEQINSRKVDNALDGKKGNVSEKLHETNNLDNKNSEVAANSNYNTKNLVIKQSLQIQNITQITDSKRNNSKYQPFPNPLKKGKLTSTPFFTIKIKNANPEDGEPLTLQNEKELGFYRTPISGMLPFISLEEVLLQSKYPIAIKPSIQPLAASKINIFDTKDHEVAKKINQKPGKLSQFLITPFFSPDVAWYHLSNDNVNNQSTNASALEKDEKHEFSYTYGLLVDHKIKGRWGIQSGVNISNINIVAEPGILYAQPDISGNIKYRVNTSSGYGFVLPSYSANPSIGDSLYSFTSTHSLQYIGIPLAVSYAFGKSKFIFTMRAGISTNLLTKAKLETTVEKGFDNSVETTNNIQGLKKLYFNGLVGLGVNYQLNKKTSIVFAPSLRFALNSINKNDPVKSYPMSLGSVVGLQTRL